MSGIACVIGLGSMGFGAACSLLRAGFTVRGVDINPETLTAFSERGGIACKTPAEGAKGAGIIFTFVVNHAQTDAVLFGENGAIYALKPGAVVVSSATVPPAYAEELGGKLAALGLHMIDGPVSGGPLKAASGEMTIMASGSDAAFALAKPYLDAMAAKVYRLGVEPGAGSRVKMINQLLAGVHIAAACEAMALGIHAGIEPNSLYEVICNSAGSSWMFQNRVPHILEGDYAPKSAVDIFVKDLGIVLETGTGLDMNLPITRTAHELFKSASISGMGRADDASLVKLYAEQAGFELPQKKADGTTLK